MKVKLTALWIIGGAILLLIVAGIAAYGWCEPPVAEKVWDVIEKLLGVLFGGLLITLGNASAAYRRKS
jgi:hypothetical protein